MAVILRAAAVIAGLVAVCAALMAAGYPWLCLAVAGVVLIAWGLLSEADR